MIICVFIIYLFINLFMRLAASGGQRKHRIGNSLQLSRAAVTELQKKTLFP